MNKRFSPTHHIVIIGGGLAGTLSAMKILNRCADNDAAGLQCVITIVERRDTLGRGVAYSTVEKAHLVNAPAAMFSLHREDPDHFINWLETNGADNDWQVPADIAGACVPRWLYGTYVQDELKKAVQKAAGRATLRHLRSDAVRLLRRRGALSVETSSGESLAADEVVLALGVFQGKLPALETAAAMHPSFVVDPWKPENLDRLRHVSRLLLIGSSLSMVDVVASMEGRGFKGQYHVVSRRGQLVEKRQETQEWAEFLSPSSLPKSARALVALIRQQTRHNDAAGLSWHGLPASLRAWILPLWQQAPNREKLRFTRHLRSFWDVVAHRAAASSYAALEQARTDGRFFNAAGRVLSIEPKGDSLSVTLRWRRDGRQETLLFDGVVNCRGHQEHDWRRVDDIFVKNLLADGIARPHATGFGLDATNDGAVVDLDGHAQSDVLAIGHPLRGVAWESSSINEQLTQAIALADRLAARLAFPPGTPSYQEA